MRDVVRSCPIVARGDGDQHSIPCSLRVRSQPAFGIYFWSYAWVKDYFVRKREESHWKNVQSRQPVITDSPMESAITTLHASPFVPELEPSLAELTVR